jgi:hypothetical protein
VMHIVRKMFFLICLKFSRKVINMNIAVKRVRQQAM